MTFRRVRSWVVSFLFAVSLIIFPVFAEDIVWTPVSVGVADTSVASLLDSSLVFLADAGTNQYPAGIGVYSPDGYEFYTAVVDRGAGISPRYELYLLSPSDTISFAVIVRSNYESWVQSTANAVGVADGGMHYWFIRNFDLIDTDIVSSTLYSPVFDSLDAACASLGTFLAPAGSVTVSIPAGYVLYIEHNNRLSWTARTSFFIDSEILGAPFPSAGTLYGYAQTIDLSRVYSAEYDRVVPWERADAGNWLGKTRNAIWSGGFSGVGVTPQGRYMFIYNPSGALLSDMRNDVPNPIVLTVGGAVSYTLVPVSTTIDLTYGWTGIGDGTSYSGSADGGSVTWYDGDNVVVPSVGGLNSPPADDSFFSWLSGVVDSFLSIFTWGHNALSTLFSAGQAFISQLGGLYSWLPPPVLSVLTSAIVLVLAIALIKVLL